MRQQRRAAVLPPGRRPSRQTRSTADRFPSRRPARGWLPWLILAELAVAAAILVWLFGLPAGQSAGPPGTTPLAEAQPLPASPAPSPLPTQAARLRVWLAPLPASLLAAARDWAAGQDCDLVDTDRAAASLIVTWDRPAGALPVADIVLVPVAAPPALRDGVTDAALRRVWRGRPRSGDGIAQILVTPDTGPALEALWGQPGAGAPVATVVPGEVAGYLWTHPDAIAIVPFDALEARLSPLPVDGLSALDAGLDLGRYPLVARLWAARSPELAHSLAAHLEARGLHLNRHPERLTVLAMTGVTALTRHVALEIEARGDMAWPARRVADLLAAADVTHVSNEVSFLPGCRPEAETTAFCARPQYMATLQAIGADVIELTGNHNLDFGPDYALLSLDLYAEAGMSTFGGGRNAVDARRPALIVHHGNRLAFLGYNTFGPDYAWAADDGPGAARFSLDAVRADIAAARAQADLVFVNLQYTEDYGTAPLPEQVADFRAVAEAGADVVTGSQAHQPQAVEFLAGRPIFYGLGNLFFDQAWSDATRQSLIVRHTVYEGRLIAVELIPTVMDDAWQPRLADGEERAAILRQVFDAGARLPGEL